jgi:hypothetical protein
LYPIDPEKSAFLLLTTEGGMSGLYEFALNNTGTLEFISRIPLPSAMGLVSGAAMAENTAFLGTGSGLVWTYKDEKSRVMDIREQQLQVLELAASGSTLALMAEGNLLGFIPLDYRTWKEKDGIHLGDAENYTRLATDGDGPQQFLLWQPNTGAFPALRYANGQSLVLDQLSRRFPLQSASLLDDKALFLDTAGNITVLSTVSGRELFSFSAAGALDAEFYDDRNIIIGRSTVSGVSPFLMVNIETEETVPLAYSASIGARIYRTLSGSCYGAAIEQGAGNTIKTSILRLNPAKAALPVPLAEYQGEDIDFGIAECEGVLASTIGGDGAAIHSPEGIIPFERGPGLPVQLISGGSFFIALDGDGNISWHQSQTGELLAILRIDANEWVLEKNQGRVLRGPVIKD